MAQPALITGAIGLFQTLIGAIDEWHTSDEEKLQAKGQIYTVQAAVLGDILEFEEARLNARAEIIVAEAKGESWLQRNWRPLTMMTFVVILANNFIVAPYVAAFGAEVPTLEVPQGMWTMLTVGIGGYIGGRSVEKITKNSDITRLWRKPSEED